MSKPLLRAPQRLLSRLPPAWTPAPVSWSSHLTVSHGQAHPGNTVRVPDRTCRMKQGTWPWPSRRGSDAAGGQALTHTAPSVTSPLSPVTSEASGCRGSFVPQRPTGVRSFMSPPVPRAAHRWPLRRKPLDEGQTPRRYLPTGAPQGPRWSWGPP